MSCLCSRKERRDRLQGSHATFLRERYRCARSFFCRHVWRVNRGFFYSCRSDSVKSLRADGAAGRLVPCRRQSLLAESTWIRLTAKEVDRRLAAGDRCYGVELNGRLAHVLWVHCGNVFCRGADFLLESNRSTWYVYAVLTREDQRGRGLYRLGQRLLLRLALEHGIRSLVQYVEADNAVPQHVLPQLGYVQSREHFAYRIAGLRIGYRTDGQHSRRILCRGMPKSVFWI
jgi:hypothetical protein